MPTTKVKSKNAWSKEITSIVRKAGKRGITSPQLRLALEAKTKRKWSRQLLHFHVEPLRDNGIITVSGLDARNNVFHLTSVKRDAHEQNTNQTRTQAASPLNGQ